MEKTCRNCIHCTKWTEGEGHGSYFHARCLFTGRPVNLLMLGCVLHLSKRDLTAKQQAEDEKRRPGASVPLAITE